MRWDKEERLEEEKNWSLREEGEGSEGGRGEVPVPVQPRRAAEDALRTDALWVLSGTEPRTQPLTGCRGQTASGGGGTETRSSVHRGL